MPSITNLLRGAAQGAALNAQALAAVGRSGLLGPERPDKLARMGAEVARRGTFGGACSAAAIRWGSAPALSDELGTLTYEDLERRSNALARAWADDGLRAGDGIAILCRNHRGFLDASFAAAKLGLRIVFMNTEFAGPQIEDVCRARAGRHAGLRRRVRRPRPGPRRPPLPRLEQTATSSAARGRASSS